MSPGASGTRSRVLRAAEDGVPARSVVGMLLRVPLVAKIAGANAVIVTAVLWVILATRTTAGLGQQAIPLVLALSASVAVSAALVGLALRPLVGLEETARRIRAGDLAARVPDSPLADTSVRRVGTVINGLLDSLSDDRARMRDLTTKVINAGDHERAHIARELHDSTAQSLAALMLELSVLANENDNATIGVRIERIRKIVADVLDEVKTLAHVVHPRVLDDLGLPAALRHLARETELRSRTRVVVEGDAPGGSISAASAATVYRVAQEAVGNAIRHGRPEAINIRLALDNGAVRVEVQDNGCGFVLEEAERRRAGMGLYTMRERTALVGGRVEVRSALGQGTRVVVTVPSVPDRPAARADGSAVAAGMSTNEANNDW